MAAGGNARMKFLIVDDHPLIREGLSHVLLELDPKAEIVEAESADSALAAARDHPNLFLILLDLSVPGAHRLSLLQALRERHDHVPVVVLSATDDVDIVREAIDIGAMGFISKRSTTGLIVNALRQVLGGGVYVPPQTLSTLAPAVLPANAESAQRDAAGSADLLKRIGITPRQAEVLGLLIQGKPTKVISRELNLAENTVKTHVASILRALNVANRTQALFVLSRLGARLPALIAERRPPTQAGR